MGGMGYVRGLSCGAQMRIRVLEDAIFNVVSHFSLSSGAVRTVGIGEMEAVRGKEACRTIPFRVVCECSSFF